jgi:hypothetical protein
MIVLDLSILNQKGTPMFNSDTFANRPNFGIVGRIFISTDTKEFYRDTGTSWELIGGPGSGTITGSGAATQVAFWNGASTITGSNNLFWDSTNNYLGISTNTPTTALDVHHSTPSGAIFNQTTATNNNTINFQTSGAGRWRIGNFYTAGADDFGIFDVVGTLQQFTIVKTTGQTFIGAKTTASGRLVVNSATADNHLQIVGANAPSIRIDNAGSGGTQRFVFGLATATNNFIQGATAGEFCISTQSAGNMLFGMWQTTNASEVMRITTANNLLIGKTIDGGQKFQVNGTGYINDRLIIDGTTASQYIQFYNANSDRAHIYWEETTNSLSIGTYIAGGSIQFETGNNIDAAIIDSTGNLGLGVTPSSWGSIKVLQIGNAAFGGLFGTAYINANSYFDGSNYRYITTNFAALYTLNNTSGQHQWSVANSGIGGSIISFTQAMTLLANGNLLVGSLVDAGQRVQIAGDVAANGVKFPATQVPSADVNTLDDYEEGTFVPELKFGGNNVGMTYFDKIGNYTKIGRQVTVNIYIAITSLGSSTGTAAVTNLPFISGSSNRAFESSGSIKFDNILYIGMLTVYNGSASDVINFQQTTELGIETTLTNTSFNNDSEMIITMTYLT